MATTMKAAVLHGVGDLRIEDVYLPKLGSQDVLVKVTSCGVCGSDVPRILTTGTYHFSTIPGHEFGGIVSEIGAQVDPTIKGRRVAVIPLIPCRTCKACEIGHFAQCEHYDFLGSRSDGGFAQYVKVPQQNLVFVPDEIDDDSAAFLEPISVGLHAVTVGEVKFGDTVCVFGLGAIGIFIAQWAKALGASRVFAVDIDPKKVEIARKLGLENALCASNCNISEYITQTIPDGIDHIFEASGSETALKQGITIAKTMSVLTLVGRPVKTIELQVDNFEKILRKQLQIRGCWSFEFMRMPHNPWDIALEALRTGKMYMNIKKCHDYLL